MPGDRNTMLGLLLAKVETTEGTDSVPTAGANAIQIVEPLEAHGEFAFKHARPKLVVGSAIQASPPLVPKGLMGTWQNTVHMRGPGTAYSASNLPELDPFWQSAGYSSTVVTTPGSEKVTYKPAATALKSHTEYYYADGRLKKLLAAKSDIDIAFDSGAPVTATVKRTGLYQIPTDAAMAGSPAFGTTVAPVVDSVGLSINGYASGIIRKFSLTMGNQIVQRANANASGGLAPHKVRSRAPKFSIVLEDELAAAIDFETLRNARTSVALTWFLNAAQYNRLRFVAGQAFVEDVKVSDDNGTQITTISGGCYDSAFGANDAIAFSYE